MSAAEKPYLLVITKGREDGGYAAMLALKIAVSFQAMGGHVSIFLTLGGTHWAYKATGRNIEEANDMSLEAYFEQFTSLGGELMVCAPCVEAHCQIPTLDKDVLAGGMRENARYVGLTSVAERLFECRASVF